MTTFFKNLISAASGVLGMSSTGMSDLIAPQENPDAVFVANSPYSDKFFKHKRNIERMARHSRQINRR